MRILSTRAQIVHRHVATAGIVALFLASLGGFFVAQQPQAQAVGDACVWQQAGNTVTVQGNASAGAKTPLLENGIAYRLTASGTYSFWTGNSKNPQADAEFADTTDLSAADGGKGEGWHDPGPNQRTPGLSNLELLVDGLDVNWLFNGAMQYNPAHVYTYELQGANKEVALVVNDNYYQDNAGALSVKVERCDTAAGKPDLTITDIIPLPLQPVAGEDVTITVKGKNIGTATLANNAGILNLYRSFQDFEFRAGAEAMPNPLNNPVEPGEEFAYGYSGKFTSSGAKTLYLKVDNANELQELDEANNALTKTMTVASASISKPDLVVEDISYAPNWSTFSGVVLATVCNRGTAPAPAVQTHTQFTIAGVSERYGNAGGLAVNGCYQAFTLLRNYVGDNASGTYTVRVDADRDDGGFRNNVIDESNENNNSLTKAITVSAASKPDLELSNIAITTDSNTKKEQYTITVTNIGTGEVQQTVYLKLENLTTNQVFTLSANYLPGAPLLPGKEFKLSVPNPVSGQVRATVDPEKLIDESNENNNALTKTITVTDTAPDPTPRISYWYGKVNQHTEGGVWKTDPDGVSGADLDMLTYCKKWYPNTARVEAYKMETITDWKERGNVNSHTSTRQSYKCVEGDVKPDLVVEDVWFQKASSSHEGSGVVQYDSLGAKVCNKGNGAASLQVSVFTEFEVGSVKLHNSMGSDRLLAVQQCIYPVVPVNNEPSIKFNQTYSVTVRADQNTQEEALNNLLDESNENNNTLTKTVVVGDASLDLTNRISYWYGKVNQHTEGGVWKTDPDGVSGADLDMLTYCKKWYPNTARVEVYKMETITDWKERGNVNSHTSTRQSYKCVEGDVKPDFIVTDIVIKKDSLIGKNYIYTTIKNIGGAGRPHTITGIEVKDLDTGDVYTSGVTAAAYPTGYVAEAVAAYPIVEKSNGVYRLEAFVDSTNLHGESDENNNRLIKTIALAGEVEIITLPVKVPSSFELRSRQRAQVTNHKDMMITLNRIVANEPCAKEPCPSRPAVVEHIEVTVSTPGGCGAGADDRCLGAPAFSQDYSLNEGASVTVQGLTLTAADINTQRAIVTIAFPGVTTVKPDLIVIKLEVDNANALTEVSASIKNIGNKKVYINKTLGPEYIRITAEIPELNIITDGIFGSQLPISTEDEYLDPNESMDITINMPDTVLSVGKTYTYNIKVDATNVIDESNENNNSLTKTVTVAGSEFSKAEFTNIKVSDITSNSAVISWTTNQSITSNLQWGLGSDANNLNFTNSLDLDRNVLKTSHKVVLNNLQPNRRYYYLIEGQDTNGYGRGGPGVRSFETTNTSTGTITGGGHTVNGRIAKIQWRTDGRYNCSIVFKGRSDIGDDLLYPGAGISISYAGQDTSVQVDLGQLNLPNRESDRIVYYKIVCRDRNDGHKVTESSVNKIELSAPVPTQASVSTTGAPVQNDPEFSSNTEVLALRERIKRLELRITELEREVVARERQLTTRINARLTQQVKGEILLQVEGKGEAWYVDLITGQRFYLQNGQSAYQALQAFGLGITNADLAKIPVGLEERAERVDSDGDGLDDRLEEALGTDPNNPDSDGDGFKDGDEVKNEYSPRGQGRPSFNRTLAGNLEGRIALQVESRGQAWYIHDGKRYYLKDGALAYQIMRYLSLGITNDDIRQIAVGELE